VLILGCWLRGDSRSGASAPWAEGSGSRKSPAGWSSKRVRLGRPPSCPPGSTPPPARCRYGVSTVLLRCCYGVATVLLGCCSHVDGINMGVTPVRYRRDTVAIPCRLAWGYVGAARGFSILRKALATTTLAVRPRQVLLAPHVLEVNAPLNPINLRAFGMD
jgi:hypothetical protein